MRILFLAVMIAKVVSESDPCAVMLCGPGTMCITPQCVTTPCPSSSCVATPSCPTCPDGSTCAFVDGNYICREVPTACCLAMPTCPFGYSPSSGDCTEQEKQTGFCVQNTVCCSTLTCRLDSQCTADDCCEQTTVAQKIKRCRCLSESPGVCAAVSCVEGTTCSEVSVCDTHPCGRSAVCVPSSTAPYSGFQCVADPCATGPCPTNHFCEVHNGQATCKDLTGVACCEAFPVCDSHETTSTTPCSPGDTTCRRHHICCSEVYCRSSQSPPAAVTTCAHGPCSSNEWCVDDIKQCVTTPCNQYRCDPLPDACCAGAATCGEGLLSSSVPCHPSEGSLCTRNHFCCHEVFCRSALPQPPIHGQNDPCVATPCGAGSYCNVITSGYECVPNWIQCGDTACTEIALECPADTTPVRFCLGSLNTCFRLTRPECCQEQLCQSNGIYPIGTSSPSTTEVPHWAWAVIGVSALIAIILAAVLGFLFCCNNKKTKAEPDLPERIPTPIKVQPTTVAYVGEHPIPKEWKHSASSDDHELV